MKIKTSKNEMISLISKVQNIVEKKATMPVLINVLLKAKESKLQIFATDLEVSLTDKIKSEIEEEGEVAVNAKHLFEITRELDEGEMLLEVVSESRLRIKQKKTVFNIAYLKASEYPVFPTFKTENFSEVSAEILKEMIDCSIYSVSNDETRYHLNGVFFENKEVKEKSHLRMVSTDGHRLSLIDRPTNEKNLKLGVIVPRKGLTEIRKIVDSSHRKVQLAVEGSQIILKTENTRLLIRLIEGKYPDYTRLIPENIAKDREKSILVNRELFLSSIKRVSLLSNQKSKEITFIISKGKMEIISNDPELGDAKEELDIEYSNENLKIGFNAKYIMDIMNSFSEERFLISLKDSSSPAVIRPEKDKNYICVVMPIHL